MDCCPNCGNDQIYRKGKATGIVTVCCKFDGDLENVDNGEMFSGVEYTLTDTCYCNNCGKRFKYSKLIAKTDTENEDDYSKC